MTPGHHRYVALSPWSRSKVEDPLCELIGCMSCELHLPLLVHTAVIVDGSYYLFHKSIGTHRYFKVEDPSDICAPVNTMHLKETKTTTEQDQVVLQLNPPTVQVWLKLCGTDAAMVSGIHSHRPAERAGMEVGDVITVINRRDVIQEDGATVAELIRMRDSTKPLSLTVTRKQSDSILHNVKRMPGAKLGCMIES